tara:strand:+ start:170 stop:1306 length:1137 start_codon:yes stop_codon:yes gene_type:complete
MGDFGEGIDQENNMLGQMGQHNRAIKQHNQDRLDSFNSNLTTSETLAKGDVSAGREESSKQADPLKLGETGTQIGQVGKRMSDSRDVLMGKYGGKFGAFVKGGGRVGTETKLGTGVLSKGATNVSDAVKSAYRATLGGPKFRPGAAPPQATTGAQEAISAARNDEAMAQTGRQGVGTGAGRLDRTQVADPQRFAAPTEPTQITAVRPSGADPVSTVPKSLQGAADDVAGGGKSTARAIGGAAAEGVGKLGVGLGILAGGESAITDLTGGFGKLANKEEKASNALSVAGGVADTIGLAIPPLAIFGGLLGLASAVTGTIGHLEDSSSKIGSGQKKLAADKASKPPPSETPQGVASLTSLGQVASVGSTVGQKITGSSSF